MTSSRRTRKVSRCLEGVPTPEAEVELAGKESKQLSKQTPTTTATKPRTASRTWATITAEEEGRILLVVAVEVGVDVEE